MFEYEQETYGSKGRERIRVAAMAHTGKKGKVLLPPTRRQKAEGLDKVEVDVCFESHILKKVVRQDDPEYIGNLNLARNGDESCIPYFNSIPYRIASTRPRMPCSYARTTGLHRISIRRACRS